jgi:hypothetical protein
LTLRLKLLTRLLNKLLSSNCDVFALNGDGEFPVDIFLANVVADRIVNFEAVDILIDKMIDRLRRQPENVAIAIDVAKVKPALLKTFVRSFDIISVDRFSNLFDKIVELFDLLNRNSILSFDAFTDQVKLFSRSTTLW